MHSLLNEKVSVLHSVLDAILDFNIILLKGLM